MPSTPDIAQRARVFAALSDPTRLRVLELLRDNGELSGSEVAERLGISLALHCHHIRILNEVGLVMKRKEGQTTYLALNCEPLRLASVALVGRGTDN